MAGVNATLLFLGINILRICSMIKIQFFTDESLLYIHSRTVLQRLMYNLWPCNQILGRILLFTFPSQKSWIMLFFFHHTAMGQPHVLVNWDRIDMVEKCRYLGVASNSYLTFKIKPLKKNCDTNMFNLAYVCCIRHFLPSRLKKGT